MSVSGILKSIFKIQFSMAVLNSFSMSVKGFKKTAHLANSGNLACNSNHQLPFFLWTHSNTRLNFACAVTLTMPLSSWPSVIRRWDVSPHQKWGEKDQSSPLELHQISQSDLSSKLPRSHLSWIGLENQQLLS